MVGGEIASFYATIGANVDDFDKKMRGVRDEMGVLEKGFGTLQSSVSTGLKAATAVGIAAVGGLAVGIGHAVTKAVDFEQGMADIGAMMNLTAEDTATLQDHIMKLGLNDKLKVSATEAAGAVQALGTAGLDMTEIMGGASEATVLLANATGLKGSEGFASAANIATDVMAQFNIEAKDLNDAVSAIAGTTIASKFTIDDYRLALAQAGGVAGSVGVSFDDFNATIAAISPNFASGSDAGTSFKTFLQRLIPQSSEAEDAMAALGLVTTDYARMSEYLSGVLGRQVEPSIEALFEAFGQTQAGMDLAAISQDKLAKGFNGLRAQFQENEFFDDNTGMMKDMDQIAGILQNAFGDLTEEQKNEAAATIFGTDAMRAAFGLIDAGTPGIIKMKEEIGNVDAEELAKKRMDTLAGSWEVFQGVVETLTLGLGNAFIPVVRQTVDWITDLAKKYGPPVIEMFGAFATRITDFIPILSQQNLLYEDGSGVLMELAKVFGVSEEAAQSFWAEVWTLKQTVEGMIQPVIQAISTFVDWQDILNAVAVVVASIVIPAIVSFVAAAAPAIAIFTALVVASATLRTAWENDWLGIRTTTTNAFQYLTVTFGGLVTAIQQFGGQSLQELMAWASGNATTFEATRQIWEAAKQSFTTAFTDMAGKLREWGATAWAEFKERFPGAAQALQDAFASISAKFQELWAVISPLIATVVKAMQEMAAKWNASTIDMSSALGVAKTVIDGIWRIMITLVSTSVGVMIDTLKLVAQLLTGDWAGAWQTAKGIVNDVLNALKSVITTAFQTVMQIFGVNIQDITRWRDEFVNLVTQARDNVVNRLYDLKDNVINRVREFVDQTRNTIEQWRGNIVQKFQEIAGNVRDKMEEAKRNIIDPITSAVDATVTLVSGWWREITNMFGNLRNDILEYMAGIKTNIIEPVKAFITDSADKIASWVNWIVDRWQAIKDAANEKWLAIKMAVIDPVREFVQAVMDKVMSWKDWLINKFTEIWENIKKVLSPSYWLELGKDLIQGLWDGIKNAWNSFTSWLNNAWQSIKDTVEYVFERSSPSRWFMGLGTDMMLGLQYGVQDGVSGVTGAFGVLNNSIQSSMTSIVSTVGTHLNSTMQSVVEGVRYGAGLVNMATADVLHQSMIAEQQARAKWEKLRDEMAKPLPPITAPPVIPPSDVNNPNPPSVPPIILPPVIVPPPPPPPTPFNQKNLADALKDALGTQDITMPFLNLRDFADLMASTIDNAILSGKIAPSQLTAEQDIARVRAADSQDYQIGKVLDALQVLINLITTKGLGNQLNFDITSAPGDITDNRTELSVLIEYLTAIYAT